MMDFVRTPIPHNPKLAGIQWIRNPGHDIWIETIHLIYEHEKWFLSEDDYGTWQAAFGLDNFNFICALDTAKNQVIGCISVARFQPSNDAPPLVSVGMFFVKPSHRKIGLGTELWRHAFEDPRFQTVNAGLISVEEMVDKYAKGQGFDKIPDARVVACRGLVSDINPSNLVPESGIRIIEFAKACTEFGFDAIAEFDASINGGIRRDRFLKAWMEAPNSLASHVAIAENQRIVGFISLRKSFSNDLSVAPLYAESPGVAATLLRSAIEGVQELYGYRYIFFHALTTNQTARKLYVKLTVGTVVPIETLTPQFTLNPVEVKSEMLYSVTDIGTCTIF